MSRRLEIGEDLVFFWVPPRCRKCGGQRESVLGLLFLERLETRLVQRFESGRGLEVTGVDLTFREFPCLGQGW